MVSSKHEAAWQGLELHGLEAHAPPHEDVACLEHDRRVPLAAGQLEDADGLDLLQRLVILPQLTKRAHLRGTGSGSGLGLGLVTDYLLLCYSLLATCRLPLAACCLLLELLAASCSAAHQLGFADVVELLAPELPEWPGVVRVARGWWSCLSGSGW